MKINKIKKDSLILLLVILFLLLTGIWTAYAYKDTIINYYYRTMKSPQEYYVYLEKRGLYELLSGFSRDEASKEETDYAYDISSNISFGKNALNSILDTALGSNLTDLEKHLGLTLDNIGLDVLLASKDNLHNENVTIRLNDKELLTAELFLDTVTNRMSFRIPELSKAYLTNTQDETEAAANTYELKKKLHDTDLPMQILARYLELYFKKPGSVSMEQKVTLSLDKEDIECNLLTVTFTHMELKELYLDLLKTARVDEDLMSLLPLVNMTEDQYQKALDRIENIISDRYSEDSPEAVLQMKLYVDRNGRILSREVSSLDQTTIGYTVLKKEDYLEYEFNLTTAPLMDSLHINGTNRRVGDHNQGAISILAKCPSFLSTSDMNIDITYEGLKALVYDNHYFLEGAFTFSSDKLGGIQLTSVFSYEDKQQLNTTAIRLGTSPLLTIDSTNTLLSNYKVAEPDPTASLYDFQEYNQYLSGIDLEDYLTSLTKSLGIRRDALNDLLP